MSDLRHRNVLSTLLVLALVTSLGACGGGSKKSSSSKSSNDTASLTTVSASTRGQAERAKAQWVKDITTVNQAIAKWNKDIGPHAQAKDVLAVRRDAYDYRNGIYYWDKAIRKITVPDEVRPDLNSLLEANGKKIAALDGMSQSSKAADIDRYHLKVDQVDVTDSSNRVLGDLRRLSAGRPTAGMELAAVKARADKAGYPATVESSQESLQYQSGQGGFSMADAGLDIKTPRGNIRVLVVYDDTARTQLLDNARSSARQFHYPFRVVADRVYLGGSPASHSLNDDALLGKVVRAVDR